MKITLKQLNTFSQVYLTGSTQAAAKQLFLTQAAVSFSLNELEKQLGCKLFERAGKQLVANSAAKQLYTYAQEVLTRVNEIETIFSEQKFTLHLGASTTLGNYLLPKLIKAFSQQHTGINIKLSIHNTAEICAGVKNFSYDLGFIEGPNTQAGLQQQAWQTDELTWFAATDSSLLANNHQQLSLEELAHLPLIVREEGSGTRQEVEANFLNLMNSPKLIELGNSEAIKQAVLEDLGLGCLSKLALKDALTLNQVKLIHLTGLTNPQRQLSLLLHPKKHLNQPLQKLLNFLRLKENQVQPY